jgi:predicted amidohydrolase
MVAIRIGLIQMQCEKGQVQQNLGTISHYLHEAELRSVDIICFPEMSLTGYADPAQYPEAVINLDGLEVQQLLKLTEGYSSTFLVGLIEANPVGKPFITQIAVRQGVLLGYYRKLTIIDEETEWFSPGNDVPVFQVGGITFGIAIKNEAVFAECSRQGAKMVFELSAPGFYGEQASRDWQAGYAWWEGECQKYLSPYARKYGLWIGVATQAGRTTDEDFPGGGYLFAPDGERVAATINHLAGALYLDVKFETNSIMHL